MGGYDRWLKIDDGIVTTGMGFTIMNVNKYAHIFPATLRLRLPKGVAY